MPRANLKVAPPPEEQVVTPEETAAALNKVVDTYEQRNRDHMAEVHNFIVNYIVESKLPLPYISTILSMLQREVIEKALTAYSYTAE